MKNIYFFLFVLLTWLTGSAQRHTADGPTPACSPTDSTLTQSICQGDTLYFGNDTIIQSGTYTDTITNAGGCDSVITLVLTVNPPSFDTITQTICQGDTVHFGGSALTLSGYYNDTLTNITGCDSIVTLALTVNPLPVVTLTWDSMVSEGRFSAWDGIVTYCWGYNPDTAILIGGYPIGGIYSGRGVYVNGSVYYMDVLDNVFGHDTVAYTFIDSNGCHATAYDMVEKEICEGISAIPSANLFTLSPNPATDHVMIDFDAAYTGSTIYIKDITGRQLLQTKLTGTPQQISTGNLPPGIYTVTMFYNGQIGARSLVKE